MQGKFSNFLPATYCEYAIELMTSAKDDADPVTREPNIRELFFYSLFDLCSYNVRKMRKFLLMLSSEYGIKRVVILSLIYRVNLWANLRASKCVLFAACDRFEVPEVSLPSSDSCVLVSRKSWEQESKKAFVTVGPREKMCVPIALYKLFRPEAEKVVTSKIILQSTSTCCVSNPDLKFDRMTTVSSSNIKCVFLVFRLLKSR